MGKNRSEEGEARIIKTPKNITLIKSKEVVVCKK
jgi:hypothetical protein